MRLSEHLWIISPNIHDVRRSLWFINQVIDGDKFTGDLKDFEIKQGLVINYN
jgi:hypothetical protein